MNGKKKQQHLQNFPGMFWLGATFQAMWLILLSWCRGRITQLTVLEGTYLLI